MPSSQNYLINSKTKSSSLESNKDNYAEIFNNQTNNKFAKSEKQTFSVFY